MDQKVYIFIQIFGMKEYFHFKKKASFNGKQGKVHARVSINLKEEFDKYIFFKTTL